MKTFQTILLLIISASATADVIPYSPGRDMQMGMGFDSIRGVLVGRAIDVSSETMAIAKGTTGEHELHLIESREELAKAISLEVSADVGIGFFRASLESEYSREFSFKGYSFYLLIHVYRTKSETVFKDPALIETNLDPMDFYYRYGDEYVSTVTEGAEYLGIIEIESGSSREREIFKAQLEVSGLTWGARARIQTALEEIQEQRSVKVKEVYKGGAVTQAADDVESLFANAQAFAKGDLTNNTVPLWIGTKSYRGFEGYKRPKRDYRHIVLVEDYLRAHARAIDTRERLEDVINSSQKYRFDNDATKEKTILELRGEVRVIRRVERETLEKSQKFLFEDLKSEEDRLDEILKTLDESLNKLPKAYAAPPGNFFRHVELDLPADIRLVAVHQPGFGDLDTGRDDVNVTVNISVVPFRDREGTNSAIKREGGLFAVRSLRLQVMFNISELGGDHSVFKLHPLNWLSPIVYTAPKGLAITQIDGELFGYFSQRLNSYEAKQLDGSGILESAKVLCQTADSDDRNKLYVTEIKLKSIRARFDHEEEIGDR